MLLDVDDYKRGHVILDTVALCILLHYVQSSEIRAPGTEVELVMGWVPFKNVHVITSDYKERRLIFLPTHDVLYLHLLQ